MDLPKYSTPSITLPAVRPRALVSANVRRDHDPVSEAGRGGGEVGRVLDHVVAGVARRCVHGNNINIERRTLSGVEIAFLGTRKEE